MSAGLDPGLRAAFRAAHYRFTAPDGVLSLKVDTPDQRLADLLRHRRAACAAALTAFNPGGLEQAASRNQTAQAALMREVVAAGHEVLPGRHEDPAGQWPVEESALVLGISLPEARALAARYGQLAFLWIDAATSTPRLVETAAPG